MIVYAYGDDKLYNITNDLTIVWRWQCGFIKILLWLKTEAYFETVCFTFFVSTSLIAVLTVPSTRTIYKLVWERLKGSTIHPMSLHLRRRSASLKDNIWHRPVDKWLHPWLLYHYNDVMMGAMTSQINSLTGVYLTVYSGIDQRRHEISASLAFVRGIHPWAVNYPHKGPVTRIILPFDDVIMCYDYGANIRIGQYIVCWQRTSFNC